MMDLDQLMATLAGRVNARLGELLPDEPQTPAILHQAMRYSCLAPGKRIRPALVLLCANDLEGATAALDLGCAIEMIHAFSLIHDDLPAIDNDDLRRGLPTCHVKFGENVAILAGDALFALAFEVLAKAGLPGDKTVQALGLIAESVGVNGLVGGEMMDVLSEGVEIDPPTLETIHERKTAALIRVACELGALVGGFDQAAHREFGRKVGLAFQIADDVLNEVGDARATGKSVGSDRVRGKATYPAIYGIEASRTIALTLADQAAAHVQSSPQSIALRAVANYAVNRLK